MQSLISIIIPTFNRFHFLGETLDSILAQTYSNWECIVVDDGSMDYTDELMSFYLERDPRISYHHRPWNRPKGANACRNYGLELSKGDYINWFDSDDLMKPENLAVRIKSFNRDIDFVIGETINFYDHGFKKRIQRDYSIPINAENFLTFKIAWITNDVTLKRNIVKIRFNENLKSDQDFNFFSRLLFLTKNGKYVKKGLTLRRMHSDSIQGNLAKDRLKAKQLFENEYHLFTDIKYFADESMIKRLLRRLLNFSYGSSKKFTIDHNQFVVLKCLFQYKMSITIFYFLWMMMNLISGKGYFLKKMVIKRLED